MICASNEPSGNARIPIRRMPRQLATASRDARYEDGLAARKDKELIDYLEKNGSLLSRQIKKDLNYRKGGKRSL